MRQLGLIALLISGTALAQGQLNGTTRASINSGNGVFNAFDYGAKCNSNGSGTGTDDSVAIQAAITAAGVGGTVLINVPYTGNPCLISTISSGIALTPLAGQHLIGPGQLLVALDTSNVPNGDWAIAISNANGVTIQDLYLKSVSVGATTIGIEVIQSSGVKIDHSEVDFMAEGIRLDTGTQRFRLNDVRVVNNGTGLHCKSASYGLVMAGVYSNSVSAGGANILMDGCGATDFIGMTLDEAGSGAWSVRMNNASDVTLDAPDCFSSQTGGTGEGGCLRIGDGTAADTARITIRGMYAHPYDIGRPGYYNIKIVSGQDIRLQNVHTDCISSVQGTCAPLLTGDILDNGTATVYDNVNGTWKNIGNTVASAAIINAQLATPVNGTFSTSTSGGSLAATTAFFYRVTAADSLGETLASTETSVTTGAGSTNSNTITWSQVFGALAYNVYCRTTGAEQLCFTTPNGEQTTWTDTGSATPSGALPTVNTTGEIQNNGATTCAMAGTTTCTAKVAASITRCQCQATSGSVAASACAVSAGTATCTATAAATATFNVIPF